MKKFFIILAVFFCHKLFCQEFNKNENGLIYPDTTIKQLKHIVDSLNIKFRYCDLHKSYLSKSKTFVHYINVEKGAIKSIKKDLDKNISIDEFEKKYPEVEIVKNILTIRHKYKNYSDEDNIEFEGIDLSDKYNFTFRFSENVEKYQSQVKGKWIYTYRSKDKYYKESIRAIFFTDDFSEVVLPVSYARMVQYTECMVDTNTDVFLTKTNEFFKNQDGTASNVNKFLSYVNEVTKKPEYKKEFDKNNYGAFIKQLTLWDSLKFSKIDSLKEIDKFSYLLKKAVDEALEHGGSNDELEDYVGKYYSKTKALELKRKRHVFGGCSMDNSPRIHALNIAKLSAETVNWEVFLRSHLNIMNDRFERVSDGSWAWKDRKTYIKELEVLDINVTDLLLGISLRVENPSQHHYFGSISRIGRALAETQNAKDVEEAMLKMIKDNTLDDYNRVLIYYLFRNYINNLEDEVHQKNNQIELNAAVATLPSYLLHGKIKY